MFFIFIASLLNVYANATLQNEDFKSVANLQAQGLTLSQAKERVLHDSKIYVTSVAKTLAEAIADGDIAGGIDGSSQNLSPVKMKEVQVYGGQLTQTATDKYLIESGNKNLLNNPSFEHGTYLTGWTSSGTATFNEETSVKMHGNKSVRINFTSGQTARLCQSSTINTAQLNLKDMVASLNVRGTATGGKVCPQVNGSDVTTLCVNISTLDKWDEYVVIFPGGSTSSGICIDYPAQAGTTVAYIDDAHVGIMPATMTPEVAQAEYFGGLVANGATNCEWITTSGTFANFAADSDCNEFTEIGNVKKPSTKIPGLVIPAGSPSGVYKIIPKLTAFRATSTQICFFRLSDGTASGRQNFVGGSSSSGSFFAHYNESWEYNYTTSSSNVVIQVQSASGNATNICSITAPFTTSEYGFDVYYYPPKNKIYSNKSMGWYVDVNIGGANPSLGTSNVSTYTEITNGSLDMVINPGSQPAQIPCSSTNPSTGLTCAAGNESLGVVFDIPSVGTYEVCGEFSAIADTGAGVGNRVAPYFQLIETPNDSQTILQQGKSRVGHTSYNTSGTNALLNGNNLNICSSFVFTSVGKKTIRLMYEQFISGSVVASLVLLDRSAAEGQRDIHITVKPMINNEQITASFKQIDDELEEVYVFAHSSSTTIGTSNTDVIFSTEVVDTHNAYNLATGVFTAPRNGIYQITATLAIIQNLSTSERFVGVLRDASNNQLNVCSRSNGTGASSAVYTIICSSVVKLNQGQTVKLSAVSNISTALVNNLQETQIRIARIPSK